MAVDTTVPRSRRALLAAGAGAIAATAIEALGRPAPVRAEGETMVVGGEYATATSRTRLVNVTNGEDVFRAESSTGVAVYGVSANHVGVRGDTNNFIGVRGVALSGTGVRGDCDGGIGVRGDASGGSGSGVEGHSGNGMGVYGQSQNGQAVRGTSLASDKPAIIGLSVNSNTGVAGWSGSSTDPTTPAKTGVFGLANQDAFAIGVKGESTVGTGVAGVTDGDATSGVFGAANATSGTANGVFGASNADGGNGVRGWATSPTGVTSGVFGLAGSPDGYGVTGVNAADTGGAGVAGFAQSAAGESAGILGQATSPEGFGVLADTLATGTTARALVAHAPAGTGVVGWAGTGTHPAAKAKTGVFGYCAIDSSAVGARGESPAGTGVLAVSTTGNALRVAGKARFNRSGKASVPKDRNYVDVTVPGGLASNSIVGATIQMYRSGVAVAGVRHNYPTAGRIRIYLTKVASTTSSTPVAWFVTEYGS